MNLIIDIGNTATKLAVFQSDKMIKVQSVATTRYALMRLKRYLKNSPKINRGLLSSVKMIEHLELKGFKNYYQ